MNSKKCTQAESSYTLLLHYFYTTTATTTGTHSCLSHHHKTPHHHTTDTSTERQLCNRQHFPTAPHSGRSQRRQLLFVEPVQLWGACAHVDVDAGAGRLNLMSLVPRSYPAHKLDSNEMVTHARNMLSYTCEKTSCTLNETMREQGIRKNSRTRTHISIA